MFPLCLDPPRFTLYGRRNGNRAVPYVKCWVFLALLLIFYSHLKVNDVSLFFNMIFVLGFVFSIFSFIFPLFFFSLSLSATSLLLLPLLHSSSSPSLPLLSQSPVWLYLAWTHYRNTIAWLGFLTDPLTLPHFPSLTYQHIPEGGGGGGEGGGFWGADCALLFSLRQDTFFCFGVVIDILCLALQYLYICDWQWLTTPLAISSLVFC